MPVFKFSPGGYRMDSIIKDYVFTYLSLARLTSHATNYDAVYAKLKFKYWNIRCFMSPVSQYKTQAYDEQVWGQ